jgi:hypothetical protein
LFHVTPFIQTSNNLHPETTNFFKAHSQPQPSKAFDGCRDCQSKYVGGNMMVTPS